MPAARATLFLILSERLAARQPCQCSGRGGRQSARPAPCCSSRPTPAYNCILSCTPTPRREGPAVLHRPSRTSRSGGVCMWPHWCCLGCPPAGHTRSSRDGGRSPARAPHEAGCPPGVGPGLAGAASQYPTPHPWPLDCWPQQLSELKEGRTDGKRGKLALSSRAPAGRQAHLPPLACKKVGEGQDLSGGTGSSVGLRLFPGPLGAAGICGEKQHGEDSEVSSLPSHRPPASPLPYGSSTS